MRLSTTIGYYLKAGYPFEQILHMHAQAGFDALDFSFSSIYHGPETDTDAFRQDLLRIRGLTEDAGLFFNQAHAPFYRSRDYRERLDEVRDNVIRSIRHASILGVPHIIVHPIRDILSPDPAILPHYLELNLRYFESLLPYCQEYGIRIAVENMNGSKNCNPCAQPDDFQLYLDSLDPQWFTACLDIGHARLCGDPVDHILTMGAQRLTALHVHDVDGVNDIHTLPYLGVVDWERVAAALAQIGYAGDFTFEAGGFQLCFPREMDAANLQMLAQTGKHLISRIRYYQENPACLTGNG